ncbi:hypothetical protein A0J61_01037 [Choanephora cucurbitarum]|uniref:Uncharacterized protein n=1 Tax=Choanephora cucurbitarum TaxID=101091 RepID=A0A1C7NR68_9FUNG|nr:hypothetical protein A0J61_01037 [Choanephora cucurbitarum]
MNVQFLYKDGQGHVDENGVEPMDLVVDKALFAMEAPLERPSNPVIRPVINSYAISNVIHENFPFFFFFCKCLNASAATRQLDIHIRAAQRWTKRYYEDPESILEKRRKSQNPSAVVAEVAEILTQNFVDFDVSRCTICECDINFRCWLNVSSRVPKRIKKEKDWT